MASLEMKKEMISNEIDRVLEEMKECNDIYSEKYYDLAYKLFDLTNSFREVNEVWYREEQIKNQKEEFNAGKEIGENICEKLCKILDVLVGIENDQ